MITVIYREKLTGLGFPTRFHRENFVGLLDGNRDYLTVVNGFRCLFAFNLNNNKKKN